MTTTRVLFWHRRDLRLADNLGLAAAAEPDPSSSVTARPRPAMSSRLLRVLNPLSRAR